MKNKTLHFDNGRSFNISEDGQCKEVTTYQRGNVFVIDAFFGKLGYVLASADDKKLAMISLEDGNRWSESMLFDGPNDKITKEFLDALIRTPYQYGAKNPLEYFRNNLKG